jgi:hypothetical protein
MSKRPLKCSVRSTIAHLLDGDETQGQRLPTLKGGGAARISACAGNKLKELKVCTGALVGCDSAWHECEAPTALALSAFSSTLVFGDLR